MTKLIAVPTPPSAAEVPKFRYWGSQRPPENRADVFAASVFTAPAPTNDAGDSSMVNGKIATLRMYGPIDSWGGYWGVSAKDVSTALDSFGDGVTEIRVRINSPGGEVWEAMAILNMLRAHGAKTVAIVDGLAASAASVIAAGCDETVMSPGTQLMIHDASSFTYGDAAEMRKCAEFLDSTSNAIASIYTETAGGSLESWRAIMVEETWYTAEEAVTASLADRVGVVKDAGETSTAGDEPDPEPIVIVVDDAFDLSVFTYAGREHAPAPAAVAAIKPPTASAGGSTTEGNGGSAVAFTDEQITTLRQKLGTAEDADEATILAALDEALEERTEPVENGEQIPEGHVVIPAAKLADLEAGAALATQTAKAMHDKERKSFLDSVRAKFLPANRAAWEAEYDRDPEATRTHFATAPDLIAVSEHGHDNPVDEHKAEGDAVLVALFGDEQKGA